MDNYTIAGIGEILWDVLPSAELLGGAPLNYCYHVTSLGAQGIPVSSIGGDLRGKRALLELTDRGVDVDAITVLDHCATGYVTARIDEEGIASYDFPDNVAWDFLQLNDYGEKLKNRLDAVCFGSLAQRSEVTRQVIYDFLDCLPPETVTLFDINLRQNFYSSKVLKESLKRTDILKLNDEEIVVLAGILGLRGETEELLGKIINSWDLKMAILSRGGNGSLLMTQSERSEHQGIAVNIVDTIGAGDAFTAAVTIGYLQGRALSEINERANRLAAYVCTQQGAMPVVPESLKMIPQHS